MLNLATPAGWHHCRCVLADATVSRKGSPAADIASAAVDFVVPAEGRCVSSAVRGDLDMSALATDLGTCPFSLDMVSVCHFTKVRGSTCGTYSCAAL